MGEDPAGGADAPASLTLSEPERRLLAALQRREEPFAEDELIERTQLSADAVRGGLQRLRSKHLAVVDETREELPRLTNRGRAALREGLPERRFLTLLDRGSGTLDPKDIATGGLDEEERSAAIGYLRKRGFLEAGVPFRRRADAPASDRPFPEEVGLKTLDEGTSETEPAVLKELRRRGLAEVDATVERHWSVSSEGRLLTGLAEPADQTGALTPGLLASGGWRDRPFRPYDVRASVPFRTGARPHPYLAWVREFEEILVGLGFEQSEGPLLETEFWNADVLFMPQDHPARSIQDVLSVQGAEGRPPPADLLDRVAAVHEGRALPGDEAPITPGWGGPYDRALARRPVLRSQTTAVSARFLAGKPTPPFRMFCLDRNFRRDAVDAVHHVEFGQCEGILGEAGVTLRHLVGIFRELAEAIGIRELKIRPSYFPFTEPSIEGYVRHPRLGWMEVFPGGMFRPEVVRPLGVEVPVAAWGIGIARLAMVSLGINDIRDLFRDDLPSLTGGAA